jgi:ATP-dependent HslUV protease ATP-binding subunit HslU
MDDFIRILTEPKASLVKQYVALLETEGVKLEFTKDSLEEIARFAFRVNEGTENIGARRLHTIMERVLDQISFDAPDKKGEHVKIDADYVRQMLADIVKDQDLSRYFRHRRHLSLLPRGTQEPGSPGNLRVFCG